MNPDGAPPRRARAVIGFTVGVVLLAAAVWAVTGQRDAMTQALASARAAPWWLGALALGLPLVNWLLMTAVFQVLMRPHGRVAPAEMAALIGASWLLNYLPLRPGLLGRVAYHKAVNEIPVAASVKAVLGNIGSGLVALALGGLLAFLFAGADPGPSLGAVGAAAGALTAVSAAARGRTWGPVASATMIRFVDVLVWGARYWVTFRLVGAPIDPVAALAVGVVSQTASLVPIVGNGLGLREWAVGLTVAALPVVFMAGSGTGVGLTADLVNRAAEVVAAVPVGLGALWYLHTLTRRRGRAGTSS